MSATERNWFREGYEDARKRNKELPSRCRLIVTNLVISGARTLPQDDAS